MKNKSKNKNLILRFLPYYKKYRWILYLDLLCAIIATCCELTFPMIIRFLTNAASYDISSLTVRLIVSVGAGYLLLSIINIVANYYMASIGHIMGAKLETDMRKDLFSHLKNLSYSYYDNTKLGQVMSRITNDLFDVTEFSHHCPEEFFIAAIKIIGSFIILSFVNIPLTLIVFSFLPIMFIFVTYFNKKMRKIFKETRVQIGEINSQIEDSLGGIRVVKSFANEEIEQNKFDNGNNKFLSIKKSFYKYLAGLQGSNKFFDTFMYISVAIVGAIFIIKNLINVGDFIAYLLYATTLLASILKIINFTEQFQRGMTGIDRFFEVMDTPIEIKDKENAIELKNVKGDILFKNVSFKYSDNSDHVLENINIHVYPGKSIALVGPSGCGKTTMCNLISRFYEVTSGAIYIDGINIKDITQKSLHQNIGVVQQDVYMFSGSIKENIEYGKPGASEEEIIKAAKLAGADEFIVSLDNGYDSYVGERGVKLSGGQKQRISIARVFLKNPPILILDEATSALDNYSEKVVQDSLEKLAEGRTTFTIAHRLTTIKNADEILVLTENGIEEKGIHSELIKSGGLYSEMYSMYMEL